MNRLIAFLIAIGLCAGTSFAQLLPVEPPAPTLMVDEKGTPLKMDYKIPLVGISDPGMLFSHFTQRPLVIFYFSPKCPHCQQNYPSVQKLIKEYESKGLTGLAVSVGGVTKNDIRGFMEQHNASISFFQDANRQFSDNYGNGYVPIMYLVHENGTMIRYTEGGNVAMKHLREALDLKFKKKK